MALPIKLTRTMLTRIDPYNRDEKVGINPDHIVIYAPSNSGGSNLTTVSGIISVEETLDEIYSMILHS